MDKFKSFKMISVIMGSLLVAPVFSEQGMNGNRSTMNTNANGTNLVQRDMTTKIDDNVLSQSVKTAISNSPMLKTEKVNVVVKNGIVCLSGQLNSDTEYENAIMLAQSINGVQDVNVGQLTVAKSQAPIKDTYITAKIKGALLKDRLMGKDVKAWPVSVETKNGIVFLSGKVDTEQQKNNIEKIVRTIKDVKDVKNHIQVVAAVDNTTDTTMDSNQSTNGNTSGGSY